VRTAEVTVKYPTSGGYCRYRYKNDVTIHRISLEFTGTGKEFELRVLLPKERELTKATLDERPVKASIETVEQSRYAVLQVTGLGVHHLLLDL
jgi:hypothetical protein